MGWVVLAGVVLTFLTALLGFMTALRAKRGVDAVHVLVNSNLTAVMDKLGIEVARTDQLRQTLRDADVAVPARPEKTLQPRAPEQPEHPGAGVVSGEGSP